MENEVYLPEAEFCRVYITHGGKCWGLCCRYLYGTAGDEMHHRQTGKVKKELAVAWEKLQEIQRLGPTKICLDHLRNRCFRRGCKMGNHPMPRTDPDSTNRVEFIFIGDSSLKKYLTNDLNVMNSDWYSEILCHRRTPFKFIFAYILKCLKPYGLSRENVHFTLKNSRNSDGVEVKDTNTPEGLDICEGDLVKVHLISKPVKAEFR